jgi:hypothetical protein
MRILSIDIPPTLNCNQNQVMINSNQIQNSKYQISAVNNKGQITFKFMLELLLAQHSELECITKQVVPFLKCTATISADIPGTIGDIKAQLSYDSSNYVLVGSV